MRDSVRDICSFHTKSYNYGMRMLDTVTRNFSTYDEKHEPSSQLLLVSVECIEEFVTDPINEKFCRNLRIIVFDEVHLPSVTRGMWWSQYIPHTAQLVLLSATLGNPDDVYQTVQHMQSLQEGRPRDTTVIKYNIRPIPLQPLIFKGCERPDKGVFSSSLKGAKRIGCLINQSDPTVRDIKSLAGRSVVIPDSREDQYHLGQDILSSNRELMIQKMDDVLTEAVTEPNVDNIYNLLCYLFNNDKQPVMVFNTTAEATEDLAKQMVRHIANLESEDPEVRAAQKAKNSYDKAMYRSRDKKDSGAGGKSRERATDDWGKALPDNPIESKINIHEVLRTLRKWKFPVEIEPQRKDVFRNTQWIKDCLDVGIGVYVATMKVWQKHHVFDAFRDGKISVLFSDSTISVGINLPIRTAVVCGHVQHALYKQAGGRAGRRGMDNQGYIVHMMPKDDIRMYMTRKTPEVRLKMPKYMNYADLVRLKVPANLDQYFVDDTLDDSDIQPVSQYKDTIMKTYMSTLTDGELETCQAQIRMIHKDQWHYHRLTNLIKTLPEPASILIIKLLTAGVLHKFTGAEFIDLVAMLILRIDQDIPEGTEGTEGTDADVPSAFYVPTFPRFPGFKEKLKQYITAYGLGIDIDHPTHRYLTDFCWKGKIYGESLENLAAVGEWLYIFRKGVRAIAPYNRYTKKFGDVFAKTLSDVDTLYLAARTRRSI